MKIGLDAQVAIRSFAQSLIAGDLGPDDSRDGRSHRNTFRSAGRIRSWTAAFRSNKYKPRDVSSCVRVVSPIRIHREGTFHHCERGMVFGECTDSHRVGLISRECLRTPQIMS